MNVVLKSLHVTRHRTYSFNIKNTVICSHTKIQTVLTSRVVQ